MKRLGVAVSLILLSVSLFGGFLSPQPVSAGAQALEQTALSGQTSYNSSNYTHDVAKSNVTKIFDAYLVAINQGLDAASKLQTEEGKARYNVYKILAPTLISAINNAKTAYLNSYDTNLSPAQAQIKALTEAQKSLGGSIPPLSGDMNKIQAMSIYNAFQAQLRTELEIAKTINSGGSSGNLNSNPDAIANAQAQTDKIVSAQDTGTCTLWRWSLVTCIDEGITWIIKNTLLQIAGFLLWASANIFNTSIQVGILHFSDWAPDTLYPIWIIIRQIISLAIVFIGLYLGFMYILGKEETFERYIPWVVMFGLFVNFSYPLVRTAIDISNIISLNIYASAVGSAALSGTSENTAGTLIVNALGLSGLVASATEGTTGNMLGQLNSVPAALAAVAFVAYAAFIFIRVTMIMIGRTVSLVFLTIASPLLLVDAVIPILGERAKFLRKILFEQLAVGPVFMIMLALTLKFLEVFHTTGALTSSGVGNLSGPVSTTIPVFFNIIMMLIMLHIMIKVTVSVSGTVGTWATDTIGKVGGFGLGVAAGGAGLLARKGLGAAALKARDSSWVQKNQDSFLGRRAYDLSNSVANSTFDLRNSTYVAGAAKKLGMGMGMGAKIGAEKESEERTKAIAARGARIKTRYERDVFKKDALGNIVKDKTTGQAILLHKAGDLNEEADAAKRRYLQNNGGAMFLSKKEGERLDDEMTKEYTEKNQAVKSQVEKESGGDLAEYAKLKTNEEKNNFVGNLHKELGDLKKTDPAGTGIKSMIIAKTLEDIDKKKAAEKEAFDKKITDAIDIYKAKKGEDQQKYFSNQTKEVRDAITDNLKANVSQTISGLNTATTTERIQSSSVGISEPLSTVATIESSSVNNSNIDLPLEDAQNVSFKERVAQKRIAAQKLVQQRADAEATVNTSVSQPHPPEVRPSSIPVQSSSPVVTPPVPPAANSSQAESTDAASV